MTLATRPDPNDGTRSPLYVVQSRELRPSWDGLCTDGLSYDSDREHWVYQDPGGDRIVLDDQAMVDHGYAEWGWRSERIFFTRKEADQYCRSRHYNGPFRSYGMCSEGELEAIVIALTEEACCTECEGRGYIAAIGPCGEPSGEDCPECRGDVRVWRRPDVEVSDG
jgi:hypothetical protein